MGVGLRVAMCVGVAEVIGVEVTVGCGVVDGVGEGLLEVLYMKLAKSVWSVVTLKNVR